MNLRRKTLLTVATILVTMSVAIILVISHLFIIGVMNTEKSDIEKDLERVEARLGSILSEIRTSAEDWGAWDDTYTFIQDGNQAYIDSNLAYETAANLRLNYMLFFNSSVQLAHGLAYDYRSGEEWTISNNTMAVIVQALDLMDLNFPSDSAACLVETELGIMMMAAHAITDSAGEAPMNGALVFGRYLDEATVMVMGEDIKVKAWVMPVNATTPYLDATSWNDMVSNGTLKTVGYNSSTAYGFKPFGGVDGSAAAVLMVEYPRLGLARSASEISLLVATMMLVCFVTCVGTLTYTDRFVVKRVQRLSSQVSEVGKKGIGSERVVMDGADELTRLADEVNQTLDTIMSMDLALRESERRYRAIVNDQTEMIIRMDTDGTIVFANEALLKEMRRDKESIVGKNLREVASSKQYESMMAQCQEAASAGASVTRDYQFRSLSENRYRWITWTFRAITTEGSSQGYQGVGRDLTEQKEAEIALADANRKLNLLASLTRHDVMNKLTVAHGFVTIARAQATEPRTVEYLVKAETALESIQGYLEFAKDYQRMGMAEPVWINLRRAIDKAAKGAQGNGIVVAVDVADLEILTDPLVEKVFYNIIDNSERHGGGVKHIFVSHRIDEDGLMLVFSDDGKGIPTAEKDAIFKAGYGNNTGYGLFLAREILTASGMTIVENGAPGRGARFEITIPTARYRHEPRVT